MARFAVKIHRVQISRHPNADRLEIARIGGYECCVSKHTLKTGDLAAYVPDGAEPVNDFETPAIAIY